MSRQAAPARLSGLALFLTVVTAVASGSLLLSPLPAVAQANPETPVFINELHYDNAGADKGEFVEVAGPVGTDLTAYSLVLYNGDGGAVYRTEMLTGTIGESRTFTVPIVGIEDGPADGLALVRDGSVVQFLSYGGVMFANDGPAAGLLSTDIGIEESPPPLVGSSLQLTGTGSTYGDFTWTVRRRSLQAR